MKDLNKLTEKIIGCAINVHKNLGPGFLESVYQSALAYELKCNDIAYEKEKILPVKYGKVTLEIGFRVDFLVENEIIVECKAAREINNIDKAQIINYLKVLEKEVGLLINFNELKLIEGLHRIVNNYKDK